MKTITSKDNKFFKLFKSLNTKKNRDKSKLFILDGKKLFLELIKEKISLKYLVLSENFDFQNFLKHNKIEFETLKDVEIFSLPEKMFSEITDMTNSEGIVSICNYLNEKSISSKNILLLDNVSDPGNFGTILRTANAFGFKDILVLNSVDKYNPKILRATMGAIFRTNIKKVDLEEILKLKEEYNIISTTLNEKSKDLEDFSFDGKNIIVMGNEANGVSKEVLEISDEFLKISMNSEMESLNVAIASAILMYGIFKKN